MLSRTQRLTNLSSAFAVTRDVRGLHIALTDDVITTGATMTALSELLIRAGAAAVGVVPLPHLVVNPQMGVL